MEHGCGVWLWGMAVEHGRGTWLWGMARQVGLFMTEAIHSYYIISDLVLVLSL